MDTSNKENSDDTYESSTGGEASADYTIRGADEDRTTSSSTTEGGGGGITDKIKEKIRGAKDKVVSTADKAADTTKKGISSTTTTNEQDREYEEGEAGTRFDRTKDSTQEYDEKEPMSPAKIKQHEPTAVRRDFTDQKIIESGRERKSSDDDYTREKSKTSYGEDKQGAAATTTVPLTEERLNVSKRDSPREATITKKPVTETKTVEVPVTHEEISVERRPASETTTADKPVESEQEVRVPLKSEEVQVTKQPYVKEEVSVKKKPVTETRTVSEQVTSEKVKVKGTGGEEEVEE